MAPARSGALVVLRSARRRRILLLCCCAAIVLIVKRIKRRLPATFASSSLGRLAEQRRRAKRWIDLSVTNWYALARANLAHRVEKQVESALDAAAAHARRRIKDPAMPEALQRTIDLVLDSLLPDIKHESYRVLDEHLQFLQACRIAQPISENEGNGFSPLSPRRSSPRLRCGAPTASHGSRISSVGSSSGSGSSPAVSASKPHGTSNLPPRPAVQVLRRLRAAALHTLWPHDRSVWVSLRSPGWWVLQALGLAPHGVGATCWLLLAFAVDKSDEYQLCQFIVALRSTHFMTLGVGASLYGCLQAHRCLAVAHRGDPVACRQLAPSLSPFSAIFWILQLVTTLRAFLLLPYSERKGQRIVERRAMLSLEARRALAYRQGPPPVAFMADGDMGTAQPGGVLVHMRSIDFALAALVLAASSAALLFYYHDRQMQCVHLFWIRTAHGLLSFPYLLLRLPGANTLLTHARRTGYNARGHCVPWRAGSFEAASANVDTGLLPSVSSASSPAINAPAASDAAPNADPEGHRTPPCRRPASRLNGAARSARSARSASGVAA